MHKIFSVSIPTNNINWGYNKKCINHRISAIYSNIKQKIKEIFNNKLKFFSLTFNEGDPENNFLILKDYIESLKKVDHLYEKMIKKKNTSFSKENPIFNPLLLIPEIILSKADLTSDNRNQDTYSLEEVLLLCQEYMRGLVNILNLVYSEKNKEYFDLLNLYTNYYPFLVEKGVKKNDVFNITIKMLFSIFSEVETKFIDKNFLFRTEQIYPLTLEPEGSNHIEIKSPDDTVSMRNEKSYVIMNDGKSYRSSDFFDYCYQCEESEKGMYDIHHYYLSGIPDNKSKEISLRETYAVKGVLKNAYLAFTALVLFSGIFFFSIGYFLLFSRVTFLNPPPINSDINQSFFWIDSSRLASLIVSFTGLSMSALAIMVSFRNEHRIVLFHTDSMLRYITKLVFIDFLILIFCFITSLDAIWSMNTGLLADLPWGT